MLAAGFVIRAAQGVFEVVEYGVEPNEVPQVHADSATAAGHGLVLDPGGGDAAEPVEAITEDEGVGVDEWLCPSGQLALAESRGHAEAQRRWMAFEIFGKAGGEGGLVGRAATLRVAMARPAPAGVVDLDHTRRLALGVAVEHHLQDLVLDPPGARARDGGLVHELQRGDSVFLLREQVHRPEPGGQRQLAAGEHGACGQRGLVGAVSTLQQSAGLDLGVAVGMTTLQTDKPRRPARDERRVVAPRLSPKSTKSPAAPAPSETSLDFCASDRSWLRSITPLYARRRLKPRAC